MSVKPVQLLAPFYEQVCQMRDDEWHKAWPLEASNMDHTTSCLLAPYFEVLKDITSFNVCVYGLGVLGLSHLLHLPKSWYTLP